MDELLDLFVELAKNWRVLLSTCGGFLLGLLLSRALPDLAVYLSLGGLCLGMAVGFVWQSKQPTFNF